MIDPDVVEIDVDNLSKNFGDVQAVKQVSFSVAKGEIFGFFWGRTVPVSPPQ